MIKTEIQNLINEQINKELYSSYLYKSMEAYFRNVNLNGFANWMNIQAKEEDAHAQIMFNYLVERQGRVILAPIAGPKTEWKSPLEVFQESYHHETTVTESINNIVSMAREYKDHATDNFYQWFVAEQVEEEANADGIVQQLKMIKGDSSGLFMLDKELATRTFTLPAPLAAKTKAP